MVQIKAKIISNKEVAPQHFRLVLEAPEIAKESKPGQFLHIRVHESLEPLLRRPFSIHKIVYQNSRRPVVMEIIYKIRGKGTEILSQRKEGEFLDVIGPLGNGFPLPEEHQNTRTPTNHIFLVAGGIGVAPLLFLAEELTASYQLPITVFLGAKTKDLILCTEDFKALGCEVKIATEDGSLGFKGLISDLLKNTLNTEYSIVNTLLYSAGPISMLQEIKKIANIFKIFSFGSLEENIACGLGGCLGCIVKTTYGYKRVCKDGPVFNLKEVIWE